VKRRSILKFAGAALLALAPAPSALAQSSWPERPIKIIAPFPAGSATDVWARIVAHGLTQSLGQPVVVENKTGASGQIGTDFVAKQPADGYTLLIGTPVNSIHVRLYQGKLPYDFQKDFTPVAMLAHYPLTLVVGPGSPATNVQQLLDQAKAKPGSVTYGSSGIGSSAHLAGELMEILTKSDMQHIPYRGTPAVYPDLLSGQVTMLFDNVTVAQPQVMAGKVRALMVASASRSRALPDVPSAKEVGLPELIASSYTSVFARSGTDPAIVKRLNAEINKILADKALRERMEAQGAEMLNGNTDVLSNFFNSDVARWTKVIETAGVKPE
jgi:tripartite-type tricarboxylate transporter receptor subunit TctC